MMSDSGGVFARSARIIFRLTLWLFAIAGLIGLTVHWVRWDRQNHMPSGAAVRKVLDSPDGRYKAITFEEAGGGAISPYCFQIVAVVGRYTVPENGWNEASTIFEGNCTPDIDVNWIDGVTLKITFSPDLVAQGIAAARLKANAVHGEVHVTYGVFKQ